MVADADGVAISEVRYSAFGEIRYQNGIPTTDYLYTGQRQEAEIGLYYFVARWYDPAIGRFLQADSIVPNPMSAKGFDRYAYSWNNPILYVDPSGHVPCIDGDCSLPIPAKLVTFEENGGNWQKGEKATITSVAWDVAFAFLESISDKAFDSIWHKMEKASEVWHKVYGGVVKFTREGTAKGKAGYTHSKNHISIYTPLKKPKNPGEEWLPIYGYLVRNPGYVVHELGHAFDNALCEGNPTCKSVFSNPGRSSLPKIFNSPDHGNAPNGFHGFYDGWDKWQYGGNRGDEYGPGEIFADMFLGWTYNSWNRSREGAEMAALRSNHMTVNMAKWISQLVGDE